MARVLIENCAGATHAQLVIDEFDSAERFPTPEALRAACLRLAEVCECGKAKWQHRDGGACRRFSGNPVEDDGLTKTAAGYAKFKESVPTIPGVPWEVALQVQSLKIGIRPASKDRARGDEECFLEACAAIRAGRQPDYKLLEARMRALFPWMWKGGSGSLVRAGASDRLKQLDGFARTE